MTSSYLSGTNRKAAASAADGSGKGVEPATTESRAEPPPISGLRTACPESRGLGSATKASVFALESCRSKATGRKLEHQKHLASRFWSVKSKIKALAGLGPSEGCEGDSSPGLSPVSGSLACSLA